MLMFKHINDFGLNYWFKPHHMWLRFHGMWFDWQVVGGSQGSQVKLSDGSVKTVTAAHLSKPGSTTLRMTGGIITATTSSSPAATSSSQQVKYTFIDWICVLMCVLCAWIFSILLTVLSWQIQ